MKMTLTEAMRAAVEERGRDWRYPWGKAGSPWHDDYGNCVYARTDTGEPACIIGLALSKMGYDVTELANPDASGVLAELGGFTKDERYAANCAQVCQDGGRTWGEALDKFEERMNDA